jgi:hypothetical protein
MNATASIVSRVWSFCTTLHDDGDKTNLDIFCLKDKSLADLDTLPEPDKLADEIIENLEAGLESFRAVAAALA